jgi:hypothetical protein
MKMGYKKIIGVAFGTLFSLAAISPAVAQQRGSAYGTTNGSSGGSNSGSNNSGSGNNSATNTVHATPPPAQTSAPQRSSFTQPNSGSNSNQNANHPQFQRNNSNNTNSQSQQNSNQNAGRFQFQHNNPNNQTQQNGNQNSNQNAGRFQFRHNNGNTNTNINAPATQQNVNSVGVAPQQRGNNAVVTQQRGSNVNIGPQRQFVRGSSFSNPNRGSIGPNRVYRSYPGLGYGQNRITVRPYGLYYNNRGYFKSYYTPHIGFRISALPVGYYPFYYGPNQYYYSEGLYYQFNDDQYTVVEPPVGAAVNTLPDKAQSIIINGVQYYEVDGVYYQPITKDDGSVTYQIAGKDGELNTMDDAGSQDMPLQIGDMVDTLPQDCKTIKLNGQKYYVSPEGYYFQDATDEKGNPIYKIVGTPEDQADKK